MSEPQGPESRFDPSGNTEAFQAFARNTTAPELPSGRKSQVGIVIGVVATVIIVAAIVLLIVR